MVRFVVIDAARGLGADMRTRAGDDNLGVFAARWEPWFRGGALEIEVLEQNDTTWAFDVTRCRYAELYNSLGMAELGAALSCHRDGALVERYSDDIALERTQTIMQGATCCDCRHRKKSRKS